MANVNFYGPLQQALMGATPKIARIKPTAISPQAGWVGAAAQIAEGALKGFQQRREDQDRSAIMAALTAQPELTAPLSPYLANQREAQQRLPDPKLGFDPSQLYSSEGLTEIDLNQENRFAPNLGLDASQLDPQERSAEFDSGLVAALPQVNDPEMMSALIGDVISEEQERENLRPAARQELLRNLELKTPAGRRIRDQTLIGQFAQAEADRRAAELLEDERENERQVAKTLAQSNLAKELITSSGGKDSALISQHKYLDKLRENLEALTTSNAPAAEIAKAQQQVDDMETIIRATQYKDLGPVIAGFNPFTGKYEETPKGLNPAEEIDHKAASAEVEKIATVHGETINQQYESAKNAIINKEKIDMLFRALSKEGTETGIGAEFINQIKKIVLRVSQDEGLQQEVSNMESLKSLMGSEVFPLIKALGIGARGLDTPQERKFLQEVLTGSATLDKGTILHMAKMRMKEADRAIEEWQSGINNKSRDIWYGATQEPRERLSDPSSIDNRIVSVRGMNREQLEEYVHEYLPPEIIKAAVERLKELQ